MFKQNQRPSNRKEKTNQKTRQAIFFFGISAIIFTLPLKFYLPTVQGFMFDFKVWNCKMG